MANEKNLKPFTADQSREEAVKNGRKGGKASGRAKRTRKTLKEELLVLLDTSIEDENGNELRSQEAMSLALIKKAIDGDTRAFELIRDTIGEKPVDRVSLGVPDAAVIENVEKALFGSNEQ